MVDFPHDIVGLLATQTFGNFNFVHLVNAADLYVVPIGGLANPPRTMPTIAVLGDVQMFGF